MIRNRDRPELLIFVGRDVVLDASSGNVCPGVSRLVSEARDATTPALWLYDGDEKPLKNLQTVWPASTGEDESPPRPGALQKARESVTIEPDAFGGADGFGRGRAPATRPPLAARCVVVSATREGCAAGKAAGMRVVGVGEDLEDASDVAFYDLEGEYGSWACDFDDLYTPGSYWINPPVPRTLEGFHCDPWTGEQFEYSGLGGGRRNSADLTMDLTTAAEVGEQSDDDDDDGGGAPLSAAERAILDDLASPP